MVPDVTEESSERDLVALGAAVHGFPPAWGCFGDHDLVTRGANELAPHGLLPHATRHLETEIRTIQP